MKKPITYSFIIPHHNTPELLQRLIDSIPQRGDIEIIVVDDNSDDDKKANITRSDVKTIFINKEQTKGAGRARNIGMAEASGKWLLFADSDDLYKPDFLNILDEYKDDDIEILFFNVESADCETLLPGRVDRTCIEQNVINNYDGSDSSRFDVLYCRWGPWRKMLRLQYIRKYNFFYEEVPNGNDVLFSFQTSFFAKKWKVDKRKIYVLTYRQGSITYNKLSKTKYVTALNNISRRACFFKFLKQTNESYLVKKEIYSSSVMKYILGNLKRHPIMGLKILYYYISNIGTIRKGASYYVDVIKDIELKCKVLV